MNQALKDLSHCDDIGSLESALQGTLLRIGPVSRLDVLPLVGAGKRQAICLLRLDSPARQQDLMTKLGASRFRDDVCVVVELGMPD